MAVKKKAARPKAKSKPKVVAKAKAKTTTKSKPKAAAATKPKSKGMSEAEMMAQWQKAMTPSVGHARLMPMVGTWRATSTFTMAPGEPDQVYGGTSVHRMVLGGRYLEQVYKGMSMGMPFEGLGYTGFDNVQQRYVGTWMDTFSTGIMTFHGVGKPTDQRIDTVGEGIEPSGLKRVFESIVRIHNHGRHSYEMWTKGPNGKSYRMMLIEYERA
jgi:hypothetical protein